MNSSMTALQATTMIGTTVGWSDANGNALSGVVQSVAIANGTVSLNVSNSTSSYTVDMSTVTSVAPTLAASNQNNTASL